MEDDLLPSKGFEKVIFCFLKGVWRRRLTYFLLHLQSLTCLLTRPTKRSRLKYTGYFFFCFRPPQPLSNWTEPINGTEEDTRICYQVKNTKMKKLLIISKYLRGGLRIHLTCYATWQDPFSSSVHNFYKASPIFSLLDSISL